ncbi:uncharacterized protein LOC125666717 [Ostrea edulis]|uniref:uncharacterized protein LOC125666717 n=1 Tax=Ostrea edulis TaxID=37623 RepID=UPI002094ED12|nr:uncharacterized protein LOC125666717 [Ostrea edulis]
MVCDSDSIIRTDPRTVSTATDAPITSLNTVTTATDAPTTRLNTVTTATDAPTTSINTVTTATDARSTRLDINTTGTNSVRAITKETVPIPTTTIIIIILATLLVCAIGTAAGIFVAYQRRQIEETNYEPPRPYPDSNPGYAIPLHVYEAASDDRTYDEVEPSEEAEYDDTYGSPYLYVVPSFSDNV